MAGRSTSTTVSLSTSRSLPTRSASGSNHPVTCSILQGVLHVFFKLGHLTAHSRFHRPLRQSPEPGCPFRNFFADLRVLAGATPNGPATSGSTYNPVEGRPTAVRREKNSQGKFHPCVVDLATMMAPTRFVPALPSPYTTPNKLHTLDWLPNLLACHTSSLAPCQSRSDATPQELQWSALPPQNITCLFNLRFLTGLGRLYHHRRRSAPRLTTSL